jgi:hypothetical protein
LAVMGALSPGAMDRSSAVLTVLPFAIVSALTSPAVMARLVRANYRGTVLAWWPDAPRAPLYPSWPGLSRPSAHQPSGYSAGGIIPDEGHAIGRP